MLTAILTLPNLGTASFWDDDEGVNAEAGREMMDNGTWVIPTFNFELRTAKPVLLYWLQRPCYALFGVSEWSARLPSVLSAMLTVLVVYELGRSMFGRPTGLLAAMILATAIEFGMLAHAATPDATLLLFTTLAMYLFEVGHRDGRRTWWVPVAVACALATLTKGPVGVALPGLVILCYFAWNRELRRLVDRRLLWAMAAFLLVAGPWYGMVTAETRGAWARAFFGTENVNRFLAPMENHRGPIYYHVAALLALFAPWSLFLGTTVWNAVASARSLPTSSTPEPSPRPYRLLLCWVGVYLIFFSAAATKLPNYVLPLYPALALLTGRVLIRWRSGEVTLPRWLMPASVAGMAMVGVVVVVGLAMAGGLLPPVGGVRVYAGLGDWSWLGLIPLAGAGVMAWALRSQRRTGFLAASVLAAGLFLGLTAAFVPQVMDRYKAPRELVRESGIADPNRDLSVASFDWLKPSVVFYARRKVERMSSPEAAAAFLDIPTARYLLVPEPTWTLWVSGKVKTPHRVVCRRFDFYRNCEILVVTNEAE